jgi:PAS domain S-box-containing protein
MKSYKILIVEDSRTQADALRTLVEEHFGSAMLATSGEDALEKLEASKPSLPDVVVTDIVMPGMSGYDLTRRIKGDEALHHIPVILLTSLTDPLDIVRGLECGADNYVTKPYDPALLIARVGHAVGQRRLRRETRASMGVTVSFLGTQFTINSDREQILDLFISSVEDVVRTNHALEASQQELAAAQDQLERYARQMALRAHVSAEKYAALMQQASDAIIVLEKNDTILEANPRATVMFGRDDLRGSRLSELIASRDARGLAARLAGEDGVADEGRQDLSFVHASGREICCEVLVSHAFVEAGEFHLVILRDVTERRKEEAEVRRRNELLSAVIEASPMAIAAIDRGGNVTVWNPAAERTFGWERREVLGKSVPIVPARLLDEHQTLGDQASGPASGRDTQRMRRDGSLVDVRASSAALRDERGEPEGVVVLFEDISERKRAEQVLAERDQQLRQAQKMEAIGRLAGGVAHDFNNLLTAIRGYTHLLLTEAPEGSPMRADLEEIDKAGIRAAGLTAQLLTFSRKQVVQPRVLDINTVVDGMNRLLARLLSENIRVETSLDKNAWSVRIDAGQLEQVVMNLAVNAGDAMPDGGELLLETSNLELREPLTHSGGSVPPGSYVQLAVRDTGSGMTPETASHVFEPFFTTKEPGKGTGLGLATVYGIIEQARGFIVIDTAPGRGTKFRLLFPRAVEQPGTTAEEAKPAPQRGSETILLAEDDPAVRAVAAKTLRHAGYKVLEAQDAAAALELFGESGEGIDLVLTDAVMPGMDGGRLIESLLNRRPNLPVLMMTGYIDRELPTRTSGAPIRIVNKPFTPAQLASAIREMLA